MPGKDKKMKKAMRVMIIVWVVIALVFVGVMVSGIVYGNSFWNRSGIGFWTMGDDRNYTVVSDQSVDMDGVTLLDLEFGSQYVNIMASDGEEFRVVQQDVTEVGESERIRLEKNGSTIKVRIPTQRRVIVFGFNPPQKIDVYLPSSYHEALQLALRSGDLQMSGFQFSDGVVKVSSGDMELGDLSFDDLELEVSSGNMDLRGVEAQAVRATVSSGYMEGTRIYADKANLTVKSGNIDWEGGAQDLTMEVSSGALYANTDSAPEKLDVSVKSGDCGLAMPDNEGFTVDYTVRSGVFNNDFGDDHHAFENSGSKVHRDGSRQYRVEVSSGQFTLEEN